MKYLRTATILATLALAAPALGFAQTKPASTSMAKHAAPASTAVAKGVVKTSDTTSLVIVRSGTKDKEESFVVDTTTERHGEVVTGASVDVRYKMADGKRLATSITVHPKKAPATSKSRKHR